MQEKRLLIVGGGIAGLSLAIALRRRGIAAEIIERSIHWSAEGAGMYLVGLATRALQQLGLAEDVVREGQVIRTQKLFDQYGELLASSDVESFWAGTGPCLGLPRASVHRLLAHAASDTRIRFGITVTAIRQRSTHVEVECSDGSWGSYDLVVGADGIRSAVRSLEFGNTVPLFRGQMGWRCIAALPSHIDGWSVFLGKGRTFLIVPIGNGKAYCYADQSVAQPQHDTPEGRLQQLRELFTDFAPPVRAALHSMTVADPIHYAPIESVASLTGRDRVVLIGDAAHATSPAMASGVAMALEDALVLADIIARDCPIEQVVTQFAQCRSARVDWIRSQTDRRDRMRKLPPAMRNFLMSRLWPRLYAASYRPLLTLP
jgi:2-polyprenyl-6-methoxyphenol hydroxylase-like FAD-dependent oxidoreductase